MAHALVGFPVTCREKPISVLAPVSELASPGGLMAGLNEILNDNRTNTSHKNTLYGLSFASSRSPTLLCGLDREEGLRGCGKRGLRFGRSTHHRVD